MIEVLFVTIQNINNNINIKQYKQINTKCFEKKILYTQKCSKQITLDIGTLNSAAFLIKYILLLASVVGHVALNQISNFISVTLRLQQI